MRLGIVTVKPYRHRCGKVEQQSTNHWGPTYGSCSNCGRGYGTNGPWECMETEFEGRMKYAAEHGKPMPDLGETY